MKNKCVFLLEDNDEIRELFTYVLEDEQYQVQSYSTTASFKQSLSMQRILPDMVVLDVMLPDGNGLDICREIKDNQRTKNIPVMIMSAHARLAEMQSVCTAEEYISKPMDINEFIARIAKHVHH